MRAPLAWWIYAAGAAALALFAIGHWLWAVALDGPVLYGEGAVAHAALLARSGLEYSSSSGLGSAPLFTAANYPPLYFHLAGLGDPFVVGRVASIGGALMVGGAIAWRARHAGILVASAIALAWLGSTPVAQWGPALKPDLVALALTVLAVLVVDSKRAGCYAAGALIACAVAAKPTAALPGLALAGLLVSRDAGVLARYLAAAAVAGVAVGALTRLPDASMYLHVVSWNALPWRPELALSLLVVAAVSLALPVAVAAGLRVPRGPLAAYLIGASGIALLGGREGATINYLLDLSAALALAVATAAPRLRASVAYPAAGVLQLAAGIALLNPLGVMPGRPVQTGSWGPPARIPAMRDIPGSALVEDSGLLVATGREPIVDDLFLWSRLLARDGSFPEGESVLNAVRTGAFSAVVSEVDLTRIDDAPGAARQRWHPVLVTAILERYRFDRETDGLYVYRPR